MRITWFVSAAPTSGTERTLLHRWAAERAHAFVRAARGAGHSVETVEVAVDVDTWAVGSSLAESAVVVLSSPLGALAETLAWRARQAGCLILLDVAPGSMAVGSSLRAICDGMIGEGSGPTGVSSADRWAVVPTPVFAPEAENSSGFGFGSLRLVWVEDIAYLPDFEFQLRRLDEVGVDISLHLASNLGERTDEVAQFVSAECKRISATFTTFESVVLRSADADAVCISSLFPATQTQALVPIVANAIAASRPVFTRVFPVLGSLAELVNVGTDLVDMIATANRAPERALRGVRLAQHTLLEERSASAANAALIAACKRRQTRRTRTSSGVARSSSALSDVQVQPVIVIGMHRSGTSLLADCLGRLGCFVGDDIGPLNESALFRKVNDWCLTISDATWDRPAPVRELFDKARDRALVGEVISEMIESPAAGAYLGPIYGPRHGRIGDLPVRWGWKDPRNTFTLALWLDLFPGARVVHVLRNGIDVAVSLATRQRKLLAHHRPDLVDVISDPSARYVAGDITHTRRGDQFAGGLAIWEEHVDMARNHVEALGSQAIEVRYEQLLHDPQPVLRDLADFLRIDVSAERLDAASAAIDGTRPVRFTRDPSLRKFADSFEERLARFGTHDVLSDDAFGGLNGAG